MSQLTFDLPWPPSVNRYWRNNRGRTHISNKGRQYREDVEAALLRQYGKTITITGSVSVSILAIMPDLRQRDLDNILKATLDAITHSGFWEDDSQVDDLRVTRGPLRRNAGRLCVTITTIEREAKNDRESKTE